MYPGNQHTVHCFQPAVIATESSLELGELQRNRTVWRLDGGAGTDTHFQWLLDRGYHVIAKGLSNRRAGALAKRVRRWDRYAAADDVWLGEVAPPVEYGRPVRVFVKRQRKADTFRHSYYVSTLSLPSKRYFMAAYDARGAAEVEQFRTDKHGLGLAARRKRDFLGQKGFILLTDLAHNLMADFYHQALVGTRFEPFGLKRIVRDLLAVPGRLVFDAGQLKRVELLSLTKFSADLRMCLKKYCLGD